MAAAAPQAASVRPSSAEIRIKLAGAGGVDMDRWPFRIHRVTGYDRGDRPPDLGN